MGNPFAALQALPRPADAVTMWVETDPDAIHFLDAVFAAGPGVGNVRREYRDEGPRRMFKLFVAPGQRTRRCAPSALRRGSSAWGRSGSSGEVGAGGPRGTLDPRSGLRLPSPGRNPGDPLRPREHPLPVAGVGARRADAGPPPPVGRGGGRACRAHECRPSPGHPLVRELEGRGVVVVTRARKPLRRGFQTALRRLGIAPGQAAMVGDQVLTDILGGKRAGLVTVLVDPLGPEESRLTKINRRLERLLGRRSPTRGACAAP